MASIEKTVLNPSGIHLRPGALFVRAAAAYKASITIANVTSGSADVNAKSMIEIMRIKPKQGDRVRITAEGEDADAALEALGQAIDGGLGEALPG